MNEESVFTALTNLEPNASNEQRLKAACDLAMEVQGAFGPLREAANSGVATYSTICVLQRQLKIVCEEFERQGLV